MLVIWMVIKHGLITEALIIRIGFWCLFGAFAFDKEPSGMIMVIIRASTVA